ncbi:olfactory receptor 52P1-like [Emydura macquarii macquarii]|uniref:olfactory receptor 52P1-like n=1 Tax=Emydura macquarii macquarii TaxID=1129001 RepID=UPI00352B69CA
MVLFLVAKKQTLHKPMYLLLCMLAFTDIGMSTCIMPKAMCIFWFSSKGITVDDCLTQMFFLYAVAAMESAILVTMAFNLYVAICDALRYATILTNARIAKLGLVCLIRAVLLVLPVPLLYQRLSFCANRVILHTDIFRLSSKKAHQKALNICSAHICVMLTSYTTFLFSTLTHRFGQGIAAHVHILLANLYVLVPPMLNPIIYGVKTKELHDKVGKYTCRM